MKHAPIGILLCGVACCLTAPAAHAGPRVAPSAAQPPANGAAASFEMRAGSMVISATVPADPAPFVPDVDPSQAEAARALGERWDRGTPVPADDGTPTSVRVECPCPDLFGEFARGVARVHPNLRIEHVAPASPADRPRTGGALLSLSYSHSQPQAAARASRASSSPPASGTVTLTAIGAGDAPGVTALDSTRYVDKPWLSDFAGFVARNPDGRWIVGRTHALRPAASAADAARDARASAAEEVMRLVRARVHPDASRENGRLRAAVESALVSGDRLVVDRFPQTFERPYGNLYREAVLVDASDAKLAPLAAQLEWSVRQHRESRLKTVLSAAGVLLVTYALYRFANAFTRGYFTWSLRTAAAVFAAGAVVLIAAIA